MTKKEAEYLVAQMKSYLDQQLAAIDRRGKIDVHEFEKRYMTVSNGGCPVDHSLFRRFLNECAMGYGAINISVTEALPLEPDSNTLYFLQQENGDVSLNVYVDGEWVTGLMYFYMNYCPIELTKIRKGTKIGDRVLTFPEVWEGIYWRFHYMDQARNGCVCSRITGTFV